MNKIPKIYDALCRGFGSQKWWPTTIEGDLHPSYHGKKINEKQRFEIIVGAILAQNTSWKNVEKAIFNLNRAKLLDINKIKKASKRKIASLIKPSGYYNQKAERLKIAAGFFSKNYNPSREQLLEVKGIGPETADSILLYAFNKPIFVIDAYTKRIFSRAGMCRSKCSYSELQGKFHKSLPKNPKLFNEFHALLVELAKRNCRAKPLCAKCPISRFCEKLI